MSAKTFPLWISLICLSLSLQSAHSARKTMSASTPLYDIKVIPSSSKVYQTF